MKLSGYKGERLHRYLENKPETEDNKEKGVK